MRRFAQGAFLALLLGPPTAGQESADPDLMERVLAPDALLYLSIPRSDGIPEAYRGSNLHKLVNHPEVRDLIGPLERHWAKRKNEAATGPKGEIPSWNEQFRSEAGLTIDELREFLRGPLSLAVYDLPSGEGHALDLAFSLGAADAEKTRKQAGLLLEALRKKAGTFTESESPHEGTVIREIAADELAFFYAMVRKNLVLATNPDRLRKIISVAAAPPAALPEGRFKTARARVSPDNLHFFLLHLDAAGLLKTFRREIGDPGWKILEALGLTDIDSAALAVGYEGGFVRERLALLTARQTRGLVKCLAGGTPPPDADVPAGALACLRTALDPAEIFDALAEAVKTDPDADREFGAALQEFENRTGFKFRDVLASAGNRWTSYSILPEAGGGVPDEILTATPADPAKFEAAVRKIAAAWEIPTGEMAHAGRTIRWISLAPGPVFDTPAFQSTLAWFIKGDRLFVSGNPLALKRQAARLGKEVRPISGDPEYKALAARLPVKDAEAFYYVDVGRIFGMLYNTFEPFVHVVRDLARDDETGELILDLARMPLGETLAGLVGASLTIKRTQPDAILLDSCSNVPFVSPGGGVAAAAVVAGAALPEFMRARQRGGAFNEKTAQARLRSIHQAEEVFRDSDCDQNGVEDYWTRDVAGLYGLKYKSGDLIFLVDTDLAGADPEGAARYGLPYAPANGYAFKMMTAGPDGSPYQADEDKDGLRATHKSRFGVTAYPVPYKAAGRFTFILNEEGKIYKKDTGGAPVDRRPGKDPALEGWQPAE